MKSNSMMIRMHSMDSMPRRSSINRDPNFSLIPKLQKQGTMIKIKEKGIPKTETRIIDGVAITTSTTIIKNSPEETDENNNVKVIVYNTVLIISSLWDQNIPSHVSM